MDPKYDSVQWCLVFGILGLTAAFGNDVFPNLLGDLPDAVAAGIWGSTGGALGFAIAEIYGRVRDKLEGD